MSKLAGQSLSLARFSAPGGALPVSDRETPPQPRRPAGAPARSPQGSRYLSAQASEFSRENPARRMAIKADIPPRRQKNGSYGTYLFELAAQPGGPEGRSDTTGGSQPIASHDQPKVFALSDRVHVWMIDSPTNRDAAEAVWAGNRKDDLRDPLEHGVTLFKSTAGRTPEEILLEIIDTILDHHSEWEHAPPMSELEIYGASDIGAFSNALESVGMVVLAREGNAIIATNTFPRSTPP